MNDKNIFDSLEEEELKRIGDVPPAIKDNLDKTISLFGLLGSITELYSSSLFECISDSIGGEFDIAIIES